MRRGKFLLRTIIIAAVLAVVFPSAGNVHAAGTPAGTKIRNQATVDYTQGGGGASKNSNRTMDRVAEIIDVTVTWQDASNIRVSSGDAGKVATFRVTNTGNGPEKFVLSVNAAVGGDDFDPVLAGIYLDTNDNGTYDAGVDTLYAAGTNDPVLGSDGFTTVFVLCGIPAALADGATGAIELTATSDTGSGVPGTVFPGKGDGGGAAILGLTGGDATQSAIYQVSDNSITVSVVKSAVVIDQSGGNMPVSGSTIRYTLAVTAAGSGTASGVVITDPIPANATYIAGTLTLNGAALTDAADADAGDVGGTTPGTATVGLGDLTDASPLQTIIFDVRID